MDNIGNKIKELRRSRGLAQEELADLSKINLRTIQRIENNKNRPRPKTLNLICHALGVPIKEVLDFGTRKNHFYLATFHLSVLSFILIPFGNVIVPFILWMSKKNEITGLIKLGRRLLRFQIVWSILAYTALITFVLLKINGNKLSTTFLYITLGLYVINSILALVFAFQAKKGRIGEFYPFPNSI